jgi:hypothetical protein
MGGLNMGARIEFRLRSTLDSGRLSAVETGLMGTLLGRRSLSSYLSGVSYQRLAISSHLSPISYEMGVRAYARVGNA